MRPIGKIAILAVAAAPFAACAALPPPLELGSFENAKTVVGSSAELYTRIARGALSCWFGRDGLLKAGYVYQAEAEPASRGGAAEIVIRVKDTPPANPRGVRAFAVAIRPKGEAAEMDISLHKIPKPLGAALKADVERWAAGDVGCGGDPAGAAWKPQDPNAEPPLPPPRKKKAAAKKA